MPSAFRAPPPSLRTPMSSQTCASLLPYLLSKSVSGEPLSAILVAHAHYDHLMDIPYIAQERAPSATIYGSQTMKNILAAVLPPERLVALDNEAAEPTKPPGKWQGVPGTKIRLMAIKSEHAPHVCLFQRHGCIKVFAGEVAAPLNQLPATAWGWKEGQTLAY